MKEEDLYLREMLCTDIISFDHTFKVATNTDFLREYDSLLIAMHEKGQVVTW